MLEVKRIKALLQLVPWTMVGLVLAGGVSHDPDMETGSASLVDRNVPAVSTMDERSDGVRFAVGVPGQDRTFARLASVRLPAVDEENGDAKDDYLNQLLSNSRKLKVQEVSARTKQKTPVPDLVVKPPIEPLGMTQVTVTAPEPSAATITGLPPVDDLSEGAVKETSNSAIEASAGDSSFAQQLAQAINEVRMRRATLPKTAAGVPKAPPEVASRERGKRQVESPTFPSHLVDPEFPPNPETTNTEPGEPSAPLLREDQTELVPHNSVKAAPEPTISRRVQIRRSQTAPQADTNLSEADFPAAPEPLTNEEDATNSNSAPFIQRTPEPAVVEDQPKQTPLAASGTADLSSDNTIAMAPRFLSDEGPAEVTTIVSDPAPSPEPAVDDWITGEDLTGPLHINQHGLFSHDSEMSSAAGLSSWPCNNCGRVACACCSPPRWTARGEALFLHRSRANGFTRDVVRCLDTQLGVRSDEVPMDFRGGPRLSVSRVSDCGGLNFEGVYYLLDSWSGEDSHFGDLIIRESLTIGIGTAFVRYESRLQNVEFNVSKHLNNWTKFLIGFRYLTLDEFSSIDAVTDTTPSFHEDVTTTNDLYGGQVGLVKTLWDRGGFVTLDGSIKAGVFQNNVYRATTGFGTSPLEDEVTSFVGELGVVMDYQFSQHWTFSLGYQALWVTHVAQAIDQFGSEDALFTDETAIFHGVRTGLAFTW